MGKPKNWPNEVEFINLNAWDTKMPEFYCNSHLDLSKEIEVVDEQVTGICKGVRIQQITDPKHPAYPAFGLFALKNIPPKSHILDYRGVIKDDENASTTSDYILHFDKEFSIDAELKGNEGRFINDFRGVCKQPNVEFKLYRNAKGIVSMGVWSKLPIKKNQELCITYGKGFWVNRGITFDYYLQK
ncbi:hypothetical protein HDV02_001428 [Globomyces sp. JEL0801]|nr:hypothetical protein HDV02_001428 [Globomyces sp. JEL0801]